MTESITIRRSTAADLAAIRRLAALDSHHAPEGEAIMGLVDGELRAVVPLAGGRALADPFHLTAELVEMLRLVARRERRATVRPRRRERRRGPAILHARPA